MTAVTGNLFPYSFSVRLSKCSSHFKQKTVMVTAALIGSLIFLGVYVVAVIITWLCSKKDRKYGFSLSAFR